MKKNDHVKFTGKNLPDKLAKLPKPIYGTVVKVICKSTVEIKPRYKKYTVTVPIEAVVEVPYEKFHKKQKHPYERPKKGATKGATPKVQKETSAPKPTINVPVAEVPSNGVPREAEHLRTPADSFTPTPEVAAKPIEPVVKEPFCEEVKTHKPAIEECEDPVAELTETGSGITYVVIGVIVLAVAAAIYACLF